MRGAIIMFGVLGLLAACNGGPSVSPAAKAEARKIWADRCANCHGQTGMGDGPGAKALPVKPRAFADSTWQSQVTDEHIAKVITDGGKVVGLDANMAANPDLLAKPEVVQALVHKIRSLSP